MIFTIVSLSILFFVLYSCYSRWKVLQLWKRLGVPGPKPHFLLGNSLEIMKTGTSKTFQNWSTEYGPIVGFFIGGHPQLAITDFDLVRRVLVKDFAKFSSRLEVIDGGIYPQLTQMLAFANGELWHELRPAISPCLTGAKMRKMEPDIRQTSRDMATRLIEQSSKSENNEVVLTEALQDVLFKLSLKQMLGMNNYSDLTVMKAFRELAEPALHKSKLASLMVLFPSLQPILYPIRKRWEEFLLKTGLSFPGICYLTAAEHVHKRVVSHEGVTPDILTHLMDARKVSKPPKNVDGQDQVDDVADRKQTGPKALTEEEIVMNSLMFLIAGFTTMFSGLQFILHNLICHGDIQEQLRNELIASREENDNKEFTVEQLQQIPLLMNVIKESLRMYPLVEPFLTRISLTDYDYNGLIIPKNTGIFIGVRTIHGNPQIWAEPDKFIPSRFDEYYDKLTYLAFGGGPRTCIGKTFAYQNLMLFIAEIVCNFRLVPGPSTSFPLERKESFLSIIPKNPIVCKVFPYVPAEKK